MNKHDSVAQYFPLLHYKNNIVTRINGNKCIPVGHFCILPLFSVDQTAQLTIQISTGIYINGKSCGGRISSLFLEEDYDLPDECYLVARRAGYPYTPQEVEDLNAIWNDLILKDIRI